MKNIGRREVESDIFHTCSESNIFRFHLKEAIQYLHYYVSESDLNKCMKNKHFCLPNDSKFLFQVHYFPTTCNSSIQQFNRLSRDHFGAKQHWEPWKVKGTTKNVDFEWKACWSQTTLGTITSERNYAKCSFLSRKYLGAKQHWKLKQVKGTTQNDDFEQRALLSQATLGTIKRNHPLDFKWKTLWSQTTLWTIKKWREPPKMMILSKKHFGVKQHWKFNHNKWREPPNFHNWAEML